MKTFTTDKSKLPASLQSLDWRPMPAVFKPDDEVLAAFVSPYSKELAYIVSTVWIGDAGVFCSGCGHDHNLELSAAHWYVKIN